MFIYVFLSISTYHFPMLYSLSQINKRRKTSFNYFFLIAITNFEVYLNLNIYMYKWEVFKKKMKMSDGQSTILNYVYSAFYKNHFMESLGFFYEKFRF